MIQAQDYFVFDGVDSRAFDALVFEKSTFASPKKEYDVSKVPGRSGDLLLKNRRFQNISHTYDVIIYRNFQRNYEALRAFLLSRDGYCRLEDSMHPDEFYTAYFSGQIQPEMTRDREMGKFQLTFNRKPQRWLKSGELPLNSSWVTSQSVTNPTDFSCYPIIQVKGSSLSSGGKAINIRKTSSGGIFTQITLNAFSGSTAETNALNANSETSPLCIDLESLQSYIVSGSNTYYYNSAVKYTIHNSDFAFQLQSGASYVGIGTGSGYTFRVIPRWYRL